MRHRCCSYRETWEPQDPLVPSVWWFTNTTIAALQKRQDPSSGSKAVPKKFFGTWEQFEKVLAGNSTGNQGMLEDLI